MAFGFDMIIGDPAEMAMTAAQEAKETRLRQQAETFIPLQQQDEALAMQRKNIEDTMALRRSQFDQQVFEFNRGMEFQQAEAQRNQLNIEEQRRLTVEMDNLHNQWQMQAMETGQKNAIELRQIESQNQMYRGSIDSYYQRGERPPDALMIEYSKFLSDSSDGAIDLRKILPPEESFDIPFDLKPLLRDEKALATLKGANSDAAKVLQNWSQYTPRERKAAYGALKNVIDTLNQKRGVMAVAEQTLPQELLQTKDDNSWYDDEWETIVSGAMQYGPRFSWAVTKFADFLQAENDTPIGEFGDTVSEGRIAVTAGQLYEAIDELFTDNEYRQLRMNSITAAMSAMSDPESDFDSRPLSNFLEAVANRASSYLVDKDGNYLIGESSEKLDKGQDWSLQKDYESQIASIIQRYEDWEKNESDLRLLAASDKVSYASGKYIFYRSIVTNALRTWIADKQEYDAKQIKAANPQYTDEQIAKQLQNNEFMSTGKMEMILRDFENGVVPKDYKSPESAPLYDMINKLE